MTAFDLQGFRSELKYDGARPNLFEVQLNLPGTGIATIGNAAETTRSIAFLCRAASLPGSQMGIATTAFMGREFKHPGNPVYGDWTVTIYNDEDFTIRNSFEKWMNALNGHRSNLRNPQAVSSDQYSVDVYVMQYAKKGLDIATNRSDFRAGGSLKTYKLIGAWPSNISPIELAYDNNNTIEEYSVTFTYQWWDDVGSNVTT